MNYDDTFILRALDGRSPRWEGGTRSVYHVEDVVVKTFGGYVNEAATRWANRIEALVWNRYKDTEWAHLFAPVLASHPDGDWLVMAYARDVIGIDATVATAGEWKRSDEWEKFETTLFDIGVQDISDFNAGEIDGVLVAVDYACVSDLFEEELLNEKETA